MQSDCTTARSEPPTEVPVLGRGVHRFGFINNETEVHSMVTKSYLPPSSSSLQKPSLPPSKLGDNVTSSKKTSMIPRLVQPTCYTSIELGLPTTQARSGNVPNSYHFNPGAWCLVLVRSLTNSRHSMYSAHREA